MYRGLDANGRTGQRRAQRNGLLAGIQGASLQRGEAETLTALLSEPLLGDLSDSERRRVCASHFRGRYNNLGFTLGAAPNEAAALDILWGVETAAIAGQKTAILDLAKALGWASPEWANTTQDTVGRIQAGAEGAAFPTGIKAAALLQKDFPPVAWLVDGLILGEGLTLLAGVPIVGKSWLVLQLALAVSGGGDFWGLRRR